MPKQGEGQPVPLDGVLQRIKNAATYLATGNANWFGPGTPSAPAAPIEVEGRQYEVPINVNPLIQTKTQGIDYWQLRSFADAADIIRILIEARKDELCSMGWSIQKKQAPGDKKPTFGKPQVDSKAELLEDFFAYPDNEHDWATWLRMLLEDLLVIDAPTVYAQKTKGGDLLGWRPIDGTTVKRIIDTHGWTPAPPEVAYQQVLRGQIALSYTSDELVYKPRNVRTSKTYGMSRVEQVIVTARTYLLRQASNLAYYQDGSRPMAGFLSASASWGPKEIAIYQSLLNEQLAGDLGERQKVTVTPHDSQYTDTKSPAMKDDYDEWLARIACFCFGTSPQPFTKQMNRATADTAKESSQEQGLESDKTWVIGFMNHLLQRRMGYAAYEFTFQDREAQDPLERSQVDKIYLDEGVLTPNEVRQDLGRDPLPEPAEDEPVKPTTDAPVGGGAAPGGGAPAPVGGAAPANTGVQQLPKPKPKSPNAGKKPPNGKAAEATLAKRAPLHNPLHMHKAKDTPRTFPPHVEEQRKALASAFEVALGELGSAVVKAFRASPAEKLAKATDDDRGDSYQGDADEFAGGFSMDPLTLAWDDTNNVLSAVAQDGSKVAIAKVTVSDPDLVTADITDMANQDAIAWAAEHAADLLGKDGSGGQIAEATRNMVRHTIATGMAQGKSQDEIAADLMEDYAFTDARAKLIAETEVANASANGQLVGYTAAGLKFKKWLLSNDEGVCPICEGNQGAGWIAIGKKFPGGVQAPLQHPNCRCAIVASRKKPTE